MCIYCITPLAKGLCDTPLVLLTLKFHDLHPFIIYTPTPSVYAHPIFNCVHRGCYCTMLQCFLDKTFVFQISGEGETQTGGGRGGGSNPRASLSLYESLLMDKSIHV